MILFVYGTLKKGERNHHILGDSKFLGKATTVNKMLLLSYESRFPLLINSKKERTDFSCVHGELYDVDEPTIQVLDIFEPSFIYERKTIWVNHQFNQNTVHPIVRNGMSMATTYLVPEERIAMFGSSVQSVPSGEWSSNGKNVVNSANQKEV